MRALNYWHVLAKTPIVFLCVAAFCGCGGRRGDLPLDQNLARNSLTTALEAWKNAKQPADLAAGEPKIVVSQPHWSRGYALTKYEIKEPPVNDGMNLHFTVKLTTTSPQKKWEQHEVTSVVGTSPTITISFINPAD